MGKISSAACCMAVLAVYLLAAAPAGAQRSMENADEFNQMVIAESEKESMVQPSADNDEISWQDSSDSGTSDMSGQSCH